MNVPRLLAILIFSILIVSCAPAVETPLPTLLQPTPAATPVSAHVLISQKADQAIAALRARDLSQLAELGHPTKGLRFSPYAFVREQDYVAAIEDVPDLFSQDVVYLWGVYDGSGIPIELTFAEYYDEFIYDQDFAHAPETAYNHRLGGDGGMINNIPDFYPGGMMVEYHFPGIDPEYGGLDWRSLRLVFLPYGEDWFLVGVVHDEWTT